MLEQLKALDPAVLTDVVRQDQRNVAFEITDWDVQRLSDKGIINPDGLFLFSGNGHDGAAAQPWSIVLKVLTDPGQEVDPSNLWYWKREMLANRSGLLANLPGPVLAPRCYGIADQPKGSWIWMEHILAKSDQRWTTADYAFAAHQAGCFNAAYLTGTPLPNYPWLCKDHTRGWLDTADIASAWENPYIRRAFPASIQDRIMRLSAEREHFYAALNSLPQVFSHFDYMRRNLFIRALPKSGDEIVAVDWALCGIGAVGSEAATLVGSSALLCELQPPEWSDVEASVLDAYLAGLRDARYEVNSDHVHLGYAAWMALWTGLGNPACTAWWAHDENRSLIQQAFGCSLETMIAHEAALCEFSLNRADEARRLMRKLNLA